MTYLPKTPRSIRYFIACLTAFAGLFTMLAIEIAMGGTGGGKNPMLAGAFLGAGCAGFALAGLLGHRNKDHGIWFGILGSILTTGFGSFLGGFFWVLLSTGSSPHFLVGLTLPEALISLLQLGIFAFVVVMFLIPWEQPFIVGLWIILMTGIHLAARNARQRTGA